MSPMKFIGIEISLRIWGLGFILNLDPEFAGAGVLIIGPLSVSMNHFRYLKNGFCSFMITT